MIRPERPGGEVAIRRVHDAAFGGPLEGRIVDGLRAEARPYVGLVAEVAGAVVGHVAFSPVTVDGAAVPGVGLGPVGVLPEQQGRGLGAALVRAGLAACRADGAALAVVLGDPAYYDRFGFVPAAGHGLRCVYPVPPEAFQALALVPGGLGDVAGLVRYHPAFDAATI